jgi:type VI protein secretion system component VasK
MKILTSMALAAAALAFSMGAAAVERVDASAVQEILNRIDTLHVTSYKAPDETQKLAPELQAILDAADEAELEDTDATAD